MSRATSPSLASSNAPLALAEKRLEKRLGKLAQTSEVIDRLQRLREQAPKYAVRSIEAAIEAAYSNLAMDARAYSDTTNEYADTLLENAGQK